jgi:hypothetical protein
MGFGCQYIEALGVLWLISYCKNGDHFLSIYLERDREFKFQIMKLLKLLQFLTTVHFGGSVEVWNLDFIC